MNLSRRLVIFACLFAGQETASGETTAPRWSGLQFNAAVTSTWTENASRTSFEPTRKDAAAFEFMLQARQPRQLARNWLIECGGTAHAFVEPEFDRNNSFSAGPKLGLQRKFGLGPLAPVLRLDAAGGYKSARIQADSGWSTMADLSLSKRLSSALKAAVSGQWFEHFASSATFDIQQRTLSAEVSWSISEHWRLSGSAGRMSGRILANASPQVWAQAISGGLGATVSAYYTANPWEVTDSYGPGWVSYNAAARADLWSIALACAFSEHTTLELRSSSVFVVNKIAIRYPAASWGLSLIHRF